LLRVSKPCPTGRGLYPGVGQYRRGTLEAACGCFPRIRSRAGAGRPVPPAHPQCLLVLRPGGPASARCADPPPRRSTARGHFPAYYRANTPRRIRRLLSSVGFRDIACRDDCERRGTPALASADDRRTLLDQGHDDARRPSLSRVDDCNGEAASLMKTLEALRGRDAPACEGPWSGCRATGAS
jgi:hypothetical protein